MLQYSLFGREKKACFQKELKVRVEVRWTINKELPLPGLLRERKGKTKEMLKTEVVRLGSVKRMGISRIMGAICKHVYPWC